LAARQIQTDGKRERRREMNNGEGTRGVAPAPVEVRVETAAHASKDV
jgi:hypothetical protein